MLVRGSVPATDADEVFKNPTNGKVTFTIKAEKVPNAAGIKRVIDMLGGPTATWDDFVKDRRAFADCNFEIGAHTHAEDLQVVAPSDLAQ